MDYPTGAEELVYSSDLKAKASYLYFGLILACPSKVGAVALQSINEGDRTRAVDVVRWWVGGCVCGG